MITWLENTHLWTQPTLVAIPIIPSCKKSKLQIYLPRNIGESCRISRVLFNNIDQTTFIFKRCLSLFSSLLFHWRILKWSHWFSLIYYYYYYYFVSFISFLWEKRTSLYKTIWVPFSLFSTSALDSVVFVIHKKHNDGALCPFWYILC